MLDLHLGAMRIIFLRTRAAAAAEKKADVIQCKQRSQSERMCGLLISNCNYYNYNFIIKLLFVTDVNNLG